MRENDSTILGDVFVKQDARFSIAQQSRQSCFAFEKREIAQIFAVMLDQVEGVEDRASSGLTTGCRIFYNLADCDYPSRPELAFLLAKE